MIFEWKNYQLNKWFLFLNNENVGSNIQIINPPISITDFTTQAFKYDEKLGVYFGASESRKDVSAMGY